MGGKAAITDSLVGEASLGRWVNMLDLVRAGSHRANLSSSHPAAVEGLAARRRRVAPVDMLRHPGPRIYSVRDNGRTRRHATCAAAPV